LSVEYDSTIAILQRNQSGHYEVLSTFGNTSLLLSKWFIGTYTNFDMRGEYVSAVETTSANANFMVFKVSPEIGAISDIQFPDLQGK
jgi:hypothetical protein